MSSSSSFPIAMAEMVALYMQSILYGMVLITVAYGLRILFWSPAGYLKSRASINWVMVATILAMFTIATLDTAMGLRRNLEAFLYYTGPGGANAKFSDISDPLNVVKTIDYVLQTFIGDAIMVYRCYIVYDRNTKAVAALILLWLGEAVCGCIDVYVTAKLHTKATMSVSRLTAYVTSGLVLTLALTIMATAMIVYRILKMSGRVASLQITRLNGGRTGRTLPGSALILIESGVIYTVSVFVFVCTHLASHNSQSTVSNAIVQIIPICFVLIIIRVDQGVAMQASTIQQQSFQKPITFPVRSGMNTADRPSNAAVSGGSIYGNPGDDSYAMTDIGQASDSDGWKAAELDAAV